jgi:hypothetical protein
LKYGVVVAVAEVVVAVCKAVVLDLADMQLSHVQ